MRKDLLKIKDKIAGLVMDRQIVQKGHGIFHASRVSYTKPQAAKPQAKGAAAPEKRIFPEANMSKIGSIQHVSSKRKQAHPGNNDHISLKGKEYCSYCNTHIAKGCMQQHVNETRKHAKAFSAGVQYAFCSSCNTGHVIGTPCPAQNTSQDGTS